LRPRAHQRDLADGRPRRARRRPRRAAHPRARRGGIPMKWAAIRRKLGRVDRAIERAIERAETPGAVLLARMPRGEERIEHASRHGHAVLRPERIPMGRDTIFDLASLTKPNATATAVLWLVHDGLVALDDPVAKFLPAFAERGQ